MGKKRKQAQADAGPSTGDHGAAMDIDDFLGGGFAGLAHAEPAQNQTMRTKQTSKSKAADSSLSKPPPTSGAAEREIQSHKSQLEALKTADPEFYEYLQQSDKALLDFSDDENDLAEGDQDDGDDEEAEAQHDDDAANAARQASGAAATAPGHLDSALVQKWCAGAAENASLGAVRNVLKAFRAACHYGDTKTGDDDDSLRIMSDAAFQQILVFTLREADSFFRRLLNVVGKAHLTDADFKTAKWRKVSPLVKSYLGNALHLLAHLAEDNTSVFILQRLRASLAFLPHFEALQKKYLKLVLGLFGTSPARRVRLQALLWLRELARVGGRKSLDEVLKGVYRTYAANAAFVSKHSVADIAFMATAVVELYGLQPAVSYEHVFGFVAQLAVLLRNALTMKSADAYRDIYCWKAVNCLELWGFVLAAHAAATDLQPLVYPVTQLLLGAARLVPSPRWFPVRLRLARVLVALAAATHVYVPVAPLLLEVLAWPDFAKPAHGTGPCPDLLLQLKLSKNNLKLPSVQQELVEQAMELLATSLALSARSPAFPELVHLPTLALKRFIKASPVERFRSQARLLLDAISTNARMVGHRRDAVEFAPKDADAVAAFLRDEPDSAIPLLAYAKRLAAKASEKRVASQAHVAAVPEGPGPDDSEDTTDHVVGMDLLPRPKKQPKPAHSRSEAPLSDAQDDGDDGNDVIEEFVLSDEEVDDDVANVPLQQKDAAGTARERTPKRRHEVSDDRIQKGKAGQRGQKRAGQRSGRQRKQR